MGDKEKWVKGSDKTDTNDLLYFIYFSSYMLPINTAVTKNVVTLCFAFSF